MGLQQELPCAERRRLLLRCVESLTAVSRELAQEALLSPKKRARTIAALQEKERANIELRFHERSHGCGRSRGLHLVRRSA